MTDSFIRFSDVSFAYPEQSYLFDGLSFELGPEERVALVGPNGSGKTTLLHLIVGLLWPDEGEIEAYGRARRTESDFHEVRARTGLLFQDPEDQLFCPTVLEDVAFGPLNLGREPEEAHDIARDTLRSLGLSGYEDRVTYRLSGGEKRLVSVATVLAMDPDVLLLDEPTAGLDREFVDRIIDILQGLTVSTIVVSHDAEFLRRVTVDTWRVTGGAVNECSLEEALTPEVLRSCRK